MSSYFDVIKSHLESHGLAFEIRQGNIRPYFEMTYPTPLAKVRVVIDQHEENGIVVLQVILPVMAPVKARDELLRYLNWLNYGRLLTGNFEADMGDGEIRFRNSMDIEGSALTDRMVFNLMAAAITCVNDYCGDILAIAFGNRTAEEMIAQRGGSPEEGEDEAPSPAAGRETTFTTH